MTFVSSTKASVFPRLTMNSRFFASAAQLSWLPPALFFCLMLLIACSEPLPRTPTVHVTADSVHVWLDEHISYSSVTLLFGHDAHAYYAPYSSHHLRDGGKHVLPLQKNGEIIDSISQACPDSLMPLLDRTVLTFSDGSCRLPPWPEEEDSAAAATGMTEPVVCCPNACMSSIRRRC